jgi:phosphoglycolate phosphatase
MTDLRLVVFDMDGTIIDSQHEIVASAEHAFQTVGLAVPPRDEILSIVGLSLTDALAVLAPQLAPDEVEALAGHYRDSFVARRAAGGAEAIAPLYPGAVEAIQAISDAETLLGIATGKARRGLDHVLASHPIAHFFCTLQTADDHPSKPHPSMLLQALSDTGCDQGAAVMVGDTEFDIAMGRAAGVATIGVSWGYHPRDRLHAAGADCIVDGFADLAAALDDLWSGRR